MFHQIPRALRTFLLLSLAFPTLLFSSTGKLSLTVHGNPPAFQAYGSDRSILEVVECPPGTAVVPEGEIVNLSESSSGTYLLTLKSGVQKVSFHVPGFAPILDQRITLPAGSGARISLRVNSPYWGEMGSLRIQTNPEEVRVHLNGRAMLESTPLNLIGIPSGNYSIHLEGPPGYKSRDTTLMVHSGQITSASIQLASSPTEFVVSSDPQGASVILDGTIVGKTPYTTRTINPGFYTVIVQKRGYATTSKSISVRRGATTHTSFTLEKAEGKLKVRTYPAGADIFVNGEYVGKSPEDTELIAKLPVGHYLLETRKEKHKQQSDSVEIRQFYTKFVVLHLEPLQSMIHVDSSPEGIPVSIDYSSSQHQTPWVFTNVSPGNHSIRATFLHSLMLSQKTTVDAGDSVSVEFDFFSEMEKLRRSENQTALKSRILRNGDEQSFIGFADHPPAIKGGEEKFYKKLKYPKKAKREGIAGSVEVEFTITRDGEIENIVIIDEVPELYEFAVSVMDALHSVSFLPAELFGTAIPYRKTMSIQFTPRKK